MSKPQLLPEYIDPIKFAHLQQRIVGTVLVTALPRVLVECHTDSITGDISLVMEGGVDRESICYLKGQISGRLPLTCQRCLQECQYSFRHEFLLSPLEDEAAIDNLPSSYEAVIMREQQLSLVEIVEEEILLHLPLAIKHDERVCAVKLNSSSLIAEKNEQEQLEKPNPFAKLKSLLDK